MTHQRPLTALFALFENVAPPVRRAGRHWALIVDVVALPEADEPAVVHRWVPKEQLMPVPAQLNRTYGLR